MSGQYDDILHLPHHVSAKRPQMSMLERAAQFSPFAALTGYDAAIRETGRLTEEKIALDEEALRVLDLKYQTLMTALHDRPVVTFTYFQHDAHKAGGAYLRTTGTVKKVDTYERWILMENGIKIPMDDVLDMEGEVFANL